MLNSVPPTSSFSASRAVDSAQEKTKLDYNSFLRLLVAQMKNQDPTKPMDSTEYVAQLATFSNVEQAISTNKKLDELLQQNRLSQAVGLVGRQVASLDGLGSGLVEKVRFSLTDVIATLSDGSELKMNDRVTISQ